MSNNNDKTEAKTKVIIITRSTEYVENDKVKEGREEYGENILNELKTEKTPYSEGKKALKLYLHCKDIVDVWGGNIRKVLNTNYSGNRPPENSKGEALKAWAIEQLMLKESISSEEEKKRCYVRFEHEEYEIILVLWDVLGRISKEKVEPFGLFVEKICKDCGVDTATRNMLYVHDYQLLGTHDDDIVLDKDEDNYPDKYKGIPYYSKLKELFVHVATFGHNSFSGTFKDNILKFEFGTHVYEMIGKEEETSTTFLELREKSDKKDRLKAMGSVVYKCECSATEINEIKSGNQSKSGIDNCIEDYWERFNTEHLKNCGFSSEMPKFDFYLIFHGTEELYNGSRYDFKQDLLKNGVEKLPCIHLSLYDVFNHEEKQLSNKRYNKIIDSSIWNYYVPLEVNNNGKWEYSDNYEAFIRVLKNIAQNSHKGLYNLSVAHEYADLNARMVEQSYLEGSHQAISPFLFHSENEMRGNIEEYEDGVFHKNVNLGLIRGYRWRFLLLDDKSTANMSQQKESASLANINKLQIIAHDLQTCLFFDEDKIWYRHLGNKNGEIVVKSYGKVKDYSKAEKVCLPKFENIQIVIDCVSNVSDALMCLEKYEYDIILLDYLLENEYGYNLLKSLQIWHRDRMKDPDKYTPGPNKRFFFMFISAFTTAVHERMLETGFERTERELWYIGDGACPTNTPYLFSYQLLLLMRHRIRDLKKESEGSNTTVIELLKTIFIDTPNGTAPSEKDIKRDARNNFNFVLFMRNKYRNLEKDLSFDDEKNLAGENKDKEIPGGEYLMNMKSSLLVQSAFKYIHHFSGAFFEHLQHLVYLTAYGTIRQWEELWEEYIFVRKELVDYGGTDGAEISDAIRHYIIELKENTLK